MKLKVEIDNELIREAMAAGGYRTRREAIEAGLQLLVRVRAQAGIRRLRGKVKWEGNLQESRQGNVGLDD
jgi:Arc/MetJ family transcription regulator